MRRAVPMPQGAQLVVAPELALCGYPPEDLLLRPAFMQACAEALAGAGGGAGRSARACMWWSGIRISSVSAAMLGPSRIAVPQRFNAASVLAGGRVARHLLQARAAQLPGVRRAALLRLGPRCRAWRRWCSRSTACRFGVLICEDAWFDEPARAAKAAGAQVLCVLNASPFHLDKADEREQRMAERARARRPAAAVRAPGRRAGRGGVRRRLVRARCAGRGRARARRCFEEALALRRGRRRRRAARRGRRRCRASRRRPGRRW